MNSNLSSAYDLGHAEPGHRGDTVIELMTERILPSQFDDVRRNSEAISPEQRLMFAVLEDAVRTYQHSSRLKDARHRRLFRQTDEWFASDDTSSPFSFVTICQVFGFEPEYLRAGLRRWVSRHGINGDPSLRAMPLRIRRISGSRHQVTVARRARVMRKAS